jgi:hypothetical protein
MSAHLLFHDRSMRNFPLGMLATSVAILSSFDLNLSFKEHSSGVICDFGCKYCPLSPTVFPLLEVVLYGFMEFARVTLVSYQ